MAGAGYKLFNTGDVLTAAQVNTYLMEQTVMVFADAAARTTALTGVVSEGMISYLKDTNAVEVYNGSAWVSSDDPNAIQNTIVDAKGDLITATAADTPARLAVGNNGETLLADSSTATGLRYQPTFNGNAVINGALDFWQRGTSFTATTVYTADRWQKGGAANYTLSRQSSGLTGFTYSARIQRNSGATTTSNYDFAQALETETSLRFAGKTVVLSFWAKAGANWSAASSALTVRLIGGTGTDQTVFAGYTGSADQINTTVTLTTSWQRFSVTGTVGSTITELTPYFSFAGVGTAGANDFFEITGVQLELGSIPTAFNRAGNTLQGELGACQRYYQQYDSSAGAFTLFGIAKYVTASSGWAQKALPVSMRSTPSLTISAVGDFASDNAGGTLTAFTTFSLNSASTPQLVRFLIATGTSPFVAGYAGEVLSNNTTNAKMQLSSEL